MTSVDPPHATAHAVAGSVAASPLPPAGVNGVAAPALAPAPVPPRGAEPLVAHTPPAQTAVAQAAARQQFTAQTPAAQTPVQPTAAEQPLTPPPAASPPLASPPIAPSQAGADETPGLPGPTVRMAMMAGLAAITVGLTLRPAPAEMATGDEASSVAATQPAAAEPVAPAVSAAPEALAATAAEPVVNDSAVDAQPEPSAGSVAPPSSSADSSEPSAAPEPSVAPEESEAPASSEPAAASEAEGSGDSSAVGTDSGIFVDDFAAESGEWTSMTGTWAVADGLMVQSDPTGFDYINQLGAELPEEFDMTVSLRGRDGVLGGGVIVGQPNAGSRRGSYVIDFTDGGNFLRWGQYAADSGIYSYIGGLNVGASPDDWHELTIEVRLDTTLVYLDGAYLGALEAVGPGTVGLITSESSVEFDDLRLDPVS